MEGRVDVCRDGEWRGVIHCGQMELESTNTTLYEVCCDNKFSECDSSSLIEICLGAVAAALLALLVASSTTALVLGIKLKRISQHKQRYDIDHEPHQYVEQQLGR